MKTKTEARKAKIEIRTTEAQKQIIEKAANAEGVNLTSFVFSRVFAEAQRVLSDRSLFILDNTAWNRLGEILDSPATPNAKLKELMQTPSVLEHRRQNNGRNRKH